MNIFYWDWEFDWLNAIWQMHNPVMDKLMVVLSNLGNAGIFWITLGLVLCATKKYRKTGIEMLISITITFIIGNLVIKNLAMRARPCQISPYTDLPLLVHIPTDYSFPSGHSMNGFTASVALLCNNWKMGIPALVLAALIAFSRLYNYVHFPTDVMAGIVIGSAIAIVVHIIYEKKNKTRSL